MRRKKNLKSIKKRKKINDPTHPDYKGPWEKSTIEDYIELTEEEQSKFTNVEFVIDEEEEEEKEKLKKEKENEEVGEVEEVVEEGEEKSKKKIKIKKKSRVEIEGDYSVFHLENNNDYLGRSFMQHPTYLKADAISQNYLPKKWIHTWTGHKKGISRVEFFPKYGHLLLSSSVDAGIKLWDVNEHRNCIRTYYGHTESVIGIKFNADGKKFASYSYDKKVKIWDTETGKVLQTFEYTDYTPYSVAFHPNGKTFLIGGTDKLVTEYELESKEQLLQYDRHQGAVNSIVFLPDGDRFVTTSDDKGFRVWETSVPVTQKWHTDASMNSMPSCAIHPAGKYVACQSLDNSIQIFEAFGKYKHRKKKH